MNYRDEILDGASRWADFMIAIGYKPTGDELNAKQAWERWAWHPERTMQDRFAAQDIGGAIVKVEDNLAGRLTLYSV